MITQITKNNNIVFLTILVFTIILCSMGCTLSKRRNNNLKIYKDYTTDTITHIFPQVIVKNNIIYNMLDSLKEKYSTFSSQKNTDTLPFFAMISHPHLDDHPSISFNLTNNHIMMTEDDIFVDFITGAFQYNEIYCYTILDTLDKTYFELSNKEIEVPSLKITVVGSTLYYPSISVFELYEIKHNKLNLLKKSNTRNDFKIE